MQTKYSICNYVSGKLCYFTWAINASPYDPAPTIDFFSTFCTEPSEENKLKQRIYEKATQNPKDDIVLTEIRWYSKKKRGEERKKKKRESTSYILEKN